MFFLLELILTAAFFPGLNQFSNNTYRGVPLTWNSCFCVVLAPQADETKHNQNLSVHMLVLFRKMLQWKNSRKNIAGEKDHGKKANQKIQLLKSAQDNFTLFLKWRHLDYYTSVVTYVRVSVVFNHKEVGRFVLKFRFSALVDVMNFTRTFSVGQSNITNLHVLYSGRTWFLFSVLYIRHIHR